MDESINLAFQFEPALIEEIEKFGELRSFNDGDLVMDYGKYIRMMPLVVKGTLKVLKKDGNVTKYCCITFPAAKRARRPIAVAWKRKKVKLKLLPKVTCRSSPFLITSWMSGCASIPAGRIISCGVLTSASLRC